MGVEELLGGVEAKTGVGACDDCGLAGQVEIRWELWYAQDMLAVEEVEEGVFPATHFSDCGRKCW